jgi:hypothetical protein
VQALARAHEVLRGGQRRPQRHRQPQQLQAASGLSKGTKIGVFVGRGVDRS